MTLKSKFSLGAAAVAVLALAGSAAFADFPERKIQNIFPWAPGTVAHGVSQMIAEGMSKRLGQPLPVVATPGAGGVKAFNTALAAPADGYTIFDGYVAPLVISPMFGRADWGCDDFTPLWSATSNAFAIAISPTEERFTDFPSFIAYLKANPGKTAYNGNGLSLPHMVSAKVLQSLDLVSRPVPYDDIELGMKDLRSGVLDWLVVNPGVYNANKDNLKILVTLSELESVQRTYDGADKAQDFGIDLGISGLAPMGWNWWLVHKDTPQDRVDILNEAMEATINDPEVRAQIEATGFVLTEYSPDQYGEVCNSAREQLESAKDAITWEEEAVKAAN